MTEPERPHLIIWEARHDNGWTTLVMEQIGWDVRRLGGARLKRLRSKEDRLCPSGALCSPRSSPSVSR